MNFGKSGYFSAHWNPWISDSSPVRGTRLFFTIVNGKCYNYWTYKQNRCAVFRRMKAHLMMPDNPRNNLRILGVDPGLNITGYGLIDLCANETSLLEGGVINIPARLPLEQRLSTIFHGIQALILEFRPEALALEEVYTHYERPRVAVMMGHARGVICLAAAVNQVPVFSYAPTHIKSSLTGNGHASKEQIKRMVQIRLSLKVVPDSLDVTDALAAALCHAVRGAREADYLKLSRK